MERELIIKHPSSVASIKALEPNIPDYMLSQIRKEHGEKSIMEQIIKDLSVIKQGQVTQAETVDEVHNQVNYTNGKVRSHASQIEAMLEGFTFYLRCKKVMFWALPIMGIATLTFFGLLVKELGVVKMIEIAAASIFGSHE